MTARSRLVGELSTGPAKNGSMSRVGRGTVVCEPPKSST